MSVQSVIFKRDKKYTVLKGQPKMEWTPYLASRWLLQHGYKVKKVDVKPTQIRFRQLSPKKFTSYITRKKKPGILLVIGY